VLHEKKEKLIQSLFWNTWRKRNLGRPGRKWEKFENEFKCAGREGVFMIGLTQDRDDWTR